MQSPPDSAVILAGFLKLCKLMSQINNFALGNGNNNNNSCFTGHWEDYVR